jgi:hypothetical protein
LVESYHEKIAGKDQVEMVHFSYDESEEEALKWAKKEKFPWLTVLPSKHEATGLEEFAGDFVPEYLLISKDGKVVANGKDECFAEIAKL